MTGITVVSIEQCCHIGTLQQENKRRNTYEGPCLAVSLDQDGCEAWRRIADLHGDCFRLTKLGGAFVDVRKALADKTCMRTIWNWGSEQGYAVPGVLYEVRHFDSELETWLYSLFLQKEQAMEEAEERDQLQEIHDFLPTHKLCDWASWDEIPLTCRADFMMLRFSFEHFSRLDGGVWTYSSSQVAAPVAGIFPGRGIKWLPLPIPRYPVHRSAAAV